MESNVREAESLYTKEILEFAAVGVRYAALLEQASERDALVEQLVALLPQLYSVTLHLPSYFYSPEADYIEEYITEGAYEAVRSRILLRSSVRTYAVPLGAVRRDDLQRHADSSLHLRRPLGCLSAGRQPPRDPTRRERRGAPRSCRRCRHYFHEYWGQALLESLTALHRIYTSQLQTQDDDKDEPEESFGEEDGEEALFDLRF